MILIGAAYLFGRLIHSLSGTFSNTLDNIVPVAKYPPSGYSLRNKVWYEIRKSLPIEDDDHIVDDFFADDWAPERVSGPTLRVRYPYIDFEVIQSVKGHFEKVYGFDLENAEERTIRHFAYSALHDSQSLYERYNILVIFFRNISFTFWAIFIVSMWQWFLHFLGVSFFSSATPWLQENNSWMLILFLLTVAVISSRQLFNFSFRRNRHLVIDFYDSLSTNE